MSESSRTLKLLHTSDWHLGCTLCGRKRHDEAEAFLRWLGDAIERERADVLLVAGDVFDSIAPGNRAQELYYRFLRRIAASCCRHAVITAGNHDSPSFLNAPLELLLEFGVHIVGSITGSPDDEALVLKDESGADELVVCAVPYLRDRDIRCVEAGESLEDKERKLTDGIASHYETVCGRARELARGVPAVAMGHLFAAGGRTVEGDGVRNLYVGSLARVGADIFPEDLAYVALGHLHSPQRIGGSDRVRYSGAPLPMGFGEAEQQKSVCLVEIPPSGPASVRVLPVPRFRRLERICGDWDAIASRLFEMKAAGESAWIEAFCDDAHTVPDLRERFDEATRGSQLDILRIRSGKTAESALVGGDDGETLAELDEYEVFSRCLDANCVPAEQRPELERTYRETLVSLREDDVFAE